MKPADGLRPPAELRLAWPPGTPEPGRPDSPWVVACSGGRDSTVLLHLLRFGVGQTTPIMAVHVDHGMHADASRTADFVRGVCRSWNVPLRVVHLSEPPANEAEARHARYRALLAVVGDQGCRGIVTAHHADDQAETVWLRAARGAGVAGLRGIHGVRSDGVVRPLLQHSRADLAEYARIHGVPWREDPTNRDRRWERNRVRLEEMPGWEHAWGDAGRTWLLDIAERARPVTRTLEAWAAAELDGLTRTESPDGARRPSLDMDAGAVGRLSEGARAWVLRAAAGRLGGRLTRAGTRLAVQFSRPGPSGRRVDLGGGWRLIRSYGAVRLEGPTPARGDDGEVRIPELIPRRWRVHLGGRALEVELTRQERPGSRQPRARWETPFPPGLALPIHVRAWRPGDRIPFAYGRKKVKKVFQEARIPTWERAVHPVVADAAGDVLWIPGIARAASLDASAHGTDVWLKIRDA